ncbi:hypothetical protein BB934_29630 (plasmid) [Microvirga ossetica]|uniref:Uncharacterized protein n=1 Tax=Microvirga ossetica TaxID=1882682 RepID=A0A1B2ER47_9HYPH|nr:hypothetical protein BB934_29630 [Microvirga ossetica]
MRHLFMSCLVLTTFASSVMPAVADDQAECTAGIAMIKAELDKKPPQSTLTALQLSRFQRGGQRMLSVIPSHSLVRDADHGGQIPCCRKRRAAA